MPLRVNFLDGGAGVEFASAGVLTGEEVIEANKRIYTHENLARLRYKIVDRTGCTEYRVSPEDVQRIAAQDREAAKTNPNIAVAFVSKTELQFGMSRMWQAYADSAGFASQVFRDRKSADAWLRGLSRELDKAETADADGGSPS
ncbi:hypothetical protein JW916_04885 [Candidatus Sumerlaeota bacterium]|nr:hypothetical protein [Candidatus Sumerlaeota bacterium]